MIIVALENTKLINEDIYLTNIDFQNTFGSIDHATLLPLMEDLAFPTNVVEQIINIYTCFTTSFSCSQFHRHPHRF